MSLLNSKVGPEKLVYLQNGWKDEPYTLLMSFKPD